MSITMFEPAAGYKLEPWRLGQASGALPQSLPWELGLSDYADFFQYVRHCCFWGTTSDGSPVHVYIARETSTGSTAEAEADAEGMGAADAPVNSESFL